MSGRIFFLGNNLFKTSFLFVAKLFWLLSIFYLIAQRVFIENP